MPSSYNLDAPALAGAGLTLEVTKTRAALRYERHYNPLAQSGLAVGDTVYFDVPLPEWVRTVVVGKRTDTANPDVLTVQCQEPNLTTPIFLPIKTANAVQVGGSTANNAASEVLMQLYPIGDVIRVSLQFAAAIPAKCVLSVALYDY